MTKHGRSGSAFSYFARGEIRKTKVTGHTNSMRLNTRILFRFKYFLLLLLFHRNSKSDLEKSINLIFFISKFYAFYSRLFHY